ncbi:MAG: LptE family protein [Bacteroidales bacterium]|nr:LptE family protein [Bacteroidales bacterium]
MHFRRSLRMFPLLMAVVLSVSGCWLYSFSGTSIQPDVKTICIEPVENKAMKVNPSLANDLFEAMCDKYKKLTKLEQVSDGGDLYVLATIESYQVSAAAVTADEVAALNRLTVTVKVKFVNEKHQEDNFEKSFAAYEDYSSENSLDAVEGTLCETIIEKIVEDIFNATVANW